MTSTEVGLGELHTTMAGTNLCCSLPCLNLIWSHPNLLPDDTEHQWLITRNYITENKELTEFFKWCCIQFRILYMCLCCLNIKDKTNFTCFWTRTRNYGCLSAGDRVQLSRIVAISTQGRTLTTFLTIPLTFDSVKFFSTFLIYCHTDKSAEQNLLTA